MCGCGILGGIGFDLWPTQTVVILNHIITEFCFVLKIQLLFWKGDKATTIKWKSRLQEVVSIKICQVFKSKCFEVCLTKSSNI